MQAQVKDPIVLVQFEVPFPAQLEVPNVHSLTSAEERRGKRRNEEMIKQIEEEREGKERKGKDEPNLRK